MRYEIIRNARVFNRVKIDLEKRIIPNALEEYAHELRALVVDEINRMGISVSGDLAKSITPEVGKKLDSWLAQVGTNLKYAIYVHEGTKPHWAPIKPLLEWVEKKGIVGTYSVKTRKRTGGKKKIADENMSMARAVQRSIAKKGTKAKPFLRFVFNREKASAAKEIAKKIARHSRSI
jgi:phage gpG-like protein